jgi:hypothetical protein
VFYEDVRKAIEELFFEEIVYADDLNAFRELPGSTNNGQIISTMQNCQADVHAWGRANQVAFDPGKESMHVLSMSEPHGDSFKLLGVIFDGMLDMTEAVGGVVTDAGWKIKSLLRTRRFYCDAEMVLLYKSHLLAFLEYRTPAIYHARRGVLGRLDNVQQRFLRDAGIDELAALMSFNLAPLATRRDIAMLGLIHRTVLGKGPPHFRKHFKLAGLTASGVQRKHCRHIIDPRSELRGNSITRSALGLVAIYNLLPESIVMCSDVSSFQTGLQRLVKDRAAKGCEDWAGTLNPRIPLASHPLMAYW